MLLPFSVPRYLPAEYRIRQAVDAWEVAGCRSLRRAVFCAEQGIFAHDDSDDLDGVAIPLAATSFLAGMPDQVVGTVRVLETEPGVWAGSRLAVARPFRRVGGLGTELIRLAVCLAHARGARRFLANVQLANVALFRALHWHTLSEISLLGHLHHVMQVDLAYYPPEGAREIALMPVLKHAA